MIPLANRFFGVLALIAVAVAVVTTVLLVTRRVPDRLRDVALPTATAIVTVTTLGSLFYSEVAGYPPCVLCWYQRILMYPLVVVIGVAAVRRDRSVWIPTSILAAIGSTVAIWHIRVERNPSLGSMCDPDNSCALLWVQEFGWLTLPTMALIAFWAATALTITAREPRPGDEPGATAVPTAATGRQDHP
jgi:disulfide bond formation protein DsbB